MSIESWLPSWERYAKLLFSPASTMSLTSLLGAFLVAAFFLILRRRAKGRNVDIRGLVRGLFPMPRKHGASHRIDVVIFLINTSAIATIVGAAILSFNTVNKGVVAALVWLFGPQGVSSMPEIVQRVLITALLFLAYELGYWIYHYVSHRVTWLWEFHRVHHEAEALTPMTHFRVHPMDPLVGGNIVAVTLGITNGVVTFALGTTAPEFSIANSNVLFVLATHVFGHLFHSHVWIATTGAAGRVIMSPAHHQIHHSTNPAHFGTNLGYYLCFFDWLFGTLHMPTKQRQDLTFGVVQENPETKVQTVWHSVIMPFVRSYRGLRADIIRGATWVRRGVLTVSAKVRGLATVAIGNAALHRGDGLAADVSLANRVRAGTQQP